MKMMRWTGAETLEWMVTVKDGPHYSDDEKNFNAIVLSEKKPMDGDLVKHHKDNEARITNVIPSIGGTYHIECSITFNAMK